MKYQLLLHWNFQWYNVIRLLILRWTKYKHLPLYFLNLWSFTGCLLTSSGCRLIQSDKMHTISRYRWFFLLLILYVVNNLKLTCREMLLILLVKLMVYFVQNSFWGQISRFLRKLTLMRETLSVRIALLRCTKVEKFFDIGQKSSLHSNITDLIKLI